MVATEKKLNYSVLRERMVTEILINRGIKDQLVIAAMRKVPRHLFVAEALAASAYGNRPLPIGEKQTISQPYIIALMIEKLQLSGKEKVLEIGTGSGYQTAILAEITQRVYSIDRVRSLVHRARRLLDELGYYNVQLRVGDGSCRWPEARQFEGIIVSAASPQLPPQLVSQLAEGGRLVIPIGNKKEQRLHTFWLKEGKLIEMVDSPCSFVRLIGKYGWED